MRKRALIITGLLVLLCTCAWSQRYTYAYENELLDCMYASSGGKTAVDNTVLAAKDMLRSHGYLQNGYYAMLKKWQQAPPQVPSADFIEETGRLNRQHLEFRCTDYQQISTEPSVAQNSKFTRLSNLFKSLNKREGLNAPGIITELFNILDEEDFAHPFYDAFATAMAVRFLTYYHQLPDPHLLYPDMAVQHGPGGVVYLRIVVKAPEKILVSGNEVPLEKVPAHVKHHARQQGKMGGVNLTLEHDVQFAYFRKVMNGIQAGYRSLYEEEALKQYGKELYRLSADQKENITREYPEDIIIQNSGY